MRIDLSLVGEGWLEGDVLCARAKSRSLSEGWEGSCTYSYTSQPTSGVGGARASRQLYF